MTIYHSDLHKRKRSGGRKIPYRGRRRYEFGSPSTRTVIGETSALRTRSMGGNLKVRSLKVKYVNLSDRYGKVVRSEVLAVAENQAGVDLRRGGIVTKGAIIQTPLGRARVTSRPGQVGSISAVLIGEA